MKRIQSKQHKIGTYEISKVSLSVFDDKRFVLVDLKRFSQKEEILTGDRRFAQSGIGAYK